jgi:hypothetical protein
VHIAGLPADEGFVALNLTRELSTPMLILHGKPDSMQQEP